MFYLATRRIGENVWARMVEAVLPNLQQVAPVWEDGRRAQAAGSCLDDTNTMLLELRHVSEMEGVTPAWWADRSMVPGQLAADTYEAGQRRPGDYEAQVSQRPIAIHGMEHLGTTDRGVSMFRKQIRRGIRAVRAGDDPQGLCRAPGAVTATYGNDTVVRVARAATPAREKELMRETSRRLAESYLREPLRSAQGAPQTR